MPTGWYLSDMLLGKQHHSNGKKSFTSSPFGIDTAQSCGQEINTDFAYPSACPLEEQRCW